MRALPTAGLLAALLCATPKPPPQAPPPPQEGCPTGPVASVPAELLLGHEDGGARAVQPKFSRADFVPPTERGQWRFTATGCLAASEPTEAQGERYPPRAFAGPGGESVRIIPVGTGAIVEHDLTHACCLSANVVARVEGRVVTITEHLSGTPCRCLCESTVRTAIALPGGGKYDFVVRVVEPGGEREAFRGPFELP